MTFKIVLINNELNDYWYNATFLYTCLYLQSFQGLPVPDEEFLAVSFGAKIDYHQTVDFGKEHTHVFDIFTSTYEVFAVMWKWRDWSKELNRVVCVILDQSILLLKNFRSFNL